ncbi:MAG: PD-(D/E)XK nuclease family protein [Clostridia bacterium]|nr:PD-(D/E)XK nuclease family protein [Clostridia bacterium]
MTQIRIVLSRAPGLIPGLLKEFDRADKPVVLVPESFTLACETQIVDRSRDRGIFDINVYSPSSFVRDIRELTGRGSKKPISADGQNMIMAGLLNKNRDRLKYYGGSVGQPSLAHKLAVQIGDFARARLSAQLLRGFDMGSRRTNDKLSDVALIWDGYSEILERGFEDNVSRWQGALNRLKQSGLVKDAQLLIYGYDYINHDLLGLIEAATGEAKEIVIGLVCDDLGPDRDIFRGASDSVALLRRHLEKRRLPAPEIRTETFLPPMEPGIAYVEKSIYAFGPFDGKNADRQSAAKQTLSKQSVPDMSSVKAYYAKNNYQECLYACQTLIDWHNEGVPWEDMAVAICENDTLPSLLPLTLSEAGIPFNAKRDRPILLNGYAQYFMSLLRVLRLNFCQADVLRMMKTGFTQLDGRAVMDMENYARAHGIHRFRWLKPFRLPEDEAGAEKVSALEEMRRAFTEPISALKRTLGRRDCGGREAAQALYEYVINEGVYQKLLAKEEEYVRRGDDANIDVNRQVWSAVNDMLDSLASFIGDAHLPLRELTSMLEASLSARLIKSLPQLSRAVTVAPPQMLFSAGVRRMIVMGMQEGEVSGSSGILSDNELRKLERCIEELGEETRLNGGALSALPLGSIGQTPAELAARQKQDVYQAVSLARERLVLSASGAKSGGGVLTPSTAFRRIYEVIKAHKPENALGGAEKDEGLKPFAPAFALEEVALKLRDARNGNAGFLRGEDEADALWRRALSALYASPVWRDRAAGVLGGLNVTMASQGLTRSQADALYAVRGMTISRVETFAACPRKHLLNYGLRLFPTEDFTYERNEQGTFNHDVIKAFLDEAMGLDSWPLLSEREETELMNRVLKEQVRRWEGGVLRSDTAHKYQGAGIIHSVRTSVGGLMREFRKPAHFLPMAAEVPFGMYDRRATMKLPALNIQTDDGENTVFSGRIDRIDAYTAQDGTKYFMIVDNKMSEKQVKLASVEMGLQLQLPLYIKAAQQGLSDMESAGGLYQPIREVLVDLNEAKDPEQALAKGLKPDGMILDDKEVMRAMSLEGKRRAKDTNDTMAVVSAGELQEVIDAAVKAVSECMGRIKSGETAPKPIKDGISPCEYCDHADACLYDSTLPGCRIKEVNHKVKPQEEE